MYSASALILVIFSMIYISTIKSKNEKYSIENENVLTHGSLLCIIDGHYLLICFFEYMHTQCGRQAHCDLSSGLYGQTLFIIQPHILK